MNSIRVSRAMVCVAVSIGGAAALATSALADEVWSTEAGMVEYYEDLGSIAVFSVDDGLIFIDGLGGNYTNRGSYSGYWVGYEASDIVCAEPAIDEYGYESWSWGYFDITFLDPAFPSRWVADLTACDGPVMATVTAEPM